MEYTLRPARDGDWLALYRLHRESMRSHVVATWGPWDEGVQWRFFLSRVFGRRMQVIEVDGETAGILEVRDRDGALYLENIELATRFRGQGLGTRILRDLSGPALAEGRAVELQVLRVNPARRLYERLGFAVYGETGTHYLMRLTGEIATIAPEPAT